MKNLPDFQLKRISRRDRDCLDLKSSLGKLITWSFSATGPGIFDSCLLNTPKIVGRGNFLKWANPCLFLIYVCFSNYNTEKFSCQWDKNLDHQSKGNDADCYTTTSAPRCAWQVIILQWPRTISLKIKKHALLSPASVGNTSSHLNSEVKQHWTKSVLGWVTT